MIDRLPEDVLQDLLLLLPISSIAVCTSVSRSWRSAIHLRIQDPDFAAPYSCKRDHVLFVTFAAIRRPGHALAYRPFLDRWFDFPLPLPLPPLMVSGSSLILSQHTDGHITIRNPFGMMNQEHQIADRTSSPEIPGFKVLALIDTTPTDYKILVIDSEAMIYYLIFDSKNRRWNPLRLLPRDISVLERGVCLNGIVYFVARVPYRFLTFDPNSELWTFLILDMPVDFLVWPHLFAFEGELFLVAGIEEALDISRIGIWALDRVLMKWRFIQFLPDPFFTEFSKGGLRSFRIVERMGLIFFHNCSSNRILMSDFSVLRWWIPEPRAAARKSWMWLGLAIQPSIQFLL